ncbi:divergent polysaccharide deacetylase family protein [Salinispira pacifica]|uniref:Putative periplasmic protein n=1 Tax=Salinispira pacifica TaxID=1307761 RepID=V5WGX8_9SPIO|nr:divergent polysaccharide deacetylase family protein [Salinispira pacifica]AHC14819.1 Putative periplasmic protein [Salinispira pacifica]
MRKNSGSSKQTQSKRKPAGSRSGSRRSSGASLTPAAKRERFVRNITALLAVIVLALAGIYLLIPSGTDQSIAARDSGRGVGESETPLPVPAEPRADESAGAAEESGSGYRDSGVTGAGKSAETPASGEPEGEAALPVKIRPKLVVVIDDVGYNVEGLKPFLEIPVPVTFAVLPRLDYSRETARLISDAGQELILHLPMESQNGQDPGPGTLRSNMSGDELLREIQGNAATVPGIIGMNNHMGSKGTEDRRIVREVLEYARRDSLFFLDSRTSPQTVVPEIARDMNMKILERDIFLDNSQDTGYIMEALEKGKAVARDQGHAILIGHVWTEELAEILLENYPFIMEEGFDFATLSSIIMKGE